MKYYYYWNLLAEMKTSYRYQVEQIHQEIDALFEYAGFTSTLKDMSAIEQVSKKDEQPSA